MDDQKSLEQLISRGENDTLEFKAAIPRPEHLARLIAAFANASGGVILLGVRDDGSVSGVLQGEAEKTFNAALQRMTPRPDCTIYPYVTIGMRTVIRIDVAAEPAGPIAVPDGIFRRVDSHLEALPAQQIGHRISTVTGADYETLLAPLTSTLQTLTAKVLDLEMSLLAARSWRRRWPDMLIGAVLSALFGTILALLLLG